MQTKPTSRPPEQIIDGMARIFVEHGEGVTEADLRRHGFSNDEIIDHQAAAVREATSRMSQNA